MLPAGTSRGESLLERPIGTGRLFRNYDKDISVFVLPYRGGGRYFTDKPSLTFEQVGGEHFLNAIQTSLETYYIPVSHSSVTEAAAKLRVSGAPSGASGNE